MPFELNDLLGPLGLVFGMLALVPFLYAGKLRFGREYDEMLVEKDKQLAAMTKDRDDWRVNTEALQQLLDRQAEAYSAIAAAQLRGRKAAAP